MYIYDFEGRPIQSNSSSTSNKDCVSGSFFVIGRLYEVTAGYGLDFSQNLRALPGLKVARIYGMRNQLATSTPSAAQPTTQSASSSAKETKDRIRGMRQDKSALQRKLKAQQLELNGFLMKNSVRELKREWKKNVVPKQVVYEKVEKAKQEKRNLMKSILDTKTRMSSIKKQIYSQTHATPASAPRKHVVYGSPCNKKAESCTLDTSFDLNNAVFCATDNGIISI